MRVRILGLAWAAFLMLPIPWAVAATASAASAIAPLAEPNSWQYIVDFTIENVVKPILTLAVPAIVGMAMAWIAQKLKKHGIEIDQAKQEQFNDAAVKSLEFALTQVFSRIERGGPQGWKDPEIHHNVIQRAKEYMVDKFPDAVKNTVGSTDLERADVTLEPVMTRLLPKVITEVAASPGTPPAPSPAAVPVVEVSKPN